jgi:hypothetical protein
VTGSVIAHAPALIEDRLYPKEQALVELAVQARARGRRLLVYITHTERRDISPRLRSVLEQAGLTVAILKSDTVSADRREEWLAERVGEGADVLLCHPRLVQTGLDLIDWPSICWYQTDFSVYVMRQASRRAWRIGQNQPVEVTHLAYKGTLQAEALALVAAKMRSSLMIEGDLPEDGLAALGAVDQDVLLALARRLTEERTDDGDSLEALFARRRQAEAEVDAYLATESWNAGTASPVPTDDWDQMLEPEACAPLEAVPCDAISSDSAAGSTTSSLLRFTDLARLIRRPKSRRKAAVEAQLELFGE